MKIKIKENAYVWADDNNLRKFLQENEGAWLEVETEHLFNDQYNTKEWRIYDSMVDCVVDDARIGMGKCKYCGAMIKKGKVCSKYTKDNPSIIGSYPATTCADYGIEWFTPENTYFLKYPQGANTSKKRLLSIHDDAIKIGSYYLESFPELDYMRLYNCRKTINFKYDGKAYFVHNGIGYKQVNYLPVPYSIRERVKKAIDGLMLVNA